MNLSNTRSIALAGLLPLGMAGQQTAAAADPKNENTNKPNFIIIFADDLGYGDLGIFGHPTNKTPNLDKMAEEGQKWTSFYVAAPVSTPSRAGLLTGRLPIRSGMCSDNRRVLFPDSKGGLPQSEITIARILKENGYQTAAIGKWHLGHKSPYLPTFCQLSGARLPDDRVYDGYDISPLIFGTGKSKRDVVFYYRGQKVYAIRKGNYKAHFITQNEYNSQTTHPVTNPPMEITNSPTFHETPLLYNLNVDPSEKFNIADEHPEIIKEIRKVLEEHLAGIEPAENQLEK